MLQVATSCLCLPAKAQHTFIAMMLLYTAHTPYSFWSLVFWLRVVGAA